METGLKRGLCVGLRDSFGRRPAFPLTTAQMAAAFGSGTWAHLLNFQEASGNVTTLDTALTATLTGTAPPTYVAEYAQSGPTAGHNAIRLTGTVATVTTARFVFGNAAIEPGASSFGFAACLYLPDAPGGTATVFGMETGGDYWRVRMSTSGQLLFQIFDGALSNTVTLAYDHLDQWTVLLGTFNAATNAMTLTSQLGTVTSSAVDLGAINSASRGLAVGSTGAPRNYWGHFAVATDITGLETTPAAKISSYQSYVGLS